MAALKTWNGVLVIIHLVIAVFLIVFFIWTNSRSGANDVEQIDTALYDHVTVVDADNPSNSSVKSEKVTGSNTRLVQILIILFIVVTAIAHLMYYLNVKGFYEKGIANRNNKWRWLEYSISATLMIVAIYILSGVKNLDTVLLAIVGTIVVMLQGDLVEKALARGDKSGTIIPTIVGWLTLIVIFYVIVKNFRKRLEEARKAGVELPKWLNAVVWPMLFWFASFGVVQIAQIFRGGKYKSYEKAYVALSLFSKAFLAIFVAYGFSRRETDDE